MSLQRDLGAVVELASNCRPAIKVIQNPPRWHRQRRSGAHRRAPAGDAPNAKPKPDVKRVHFTRCTARRSPGARRLFVRAAAQDSANPEADAYKESEPGLRRNRRTACRATSWWRLYENTELDGLEKRLIDGNPMAAALANYVQAKAVSDQARAGLFPTVGLNGSVGRARESVNAPLISRLTPRYDDDNVLSGSVSYELDLWGQIRNEVAEGEANAAASAAHLENARPSRIAQLVDDYIQLRNLDHESDLLDQTVKAYSRALGLTEQRHNAGSRRDSMSPRRKPSGRRATQAAQTLAQRALMEHAIAALLGVSASTFTIKPQIVNIALPRDPSGVPATLLQRRPISPPRNGE